LDTFKHKHTCKYI